MESSGRVISQEELLTRVWGPEYRDEVQHLKVYVKRLRQKLRDNPEDPVFIRTIRGVGYIFPGREGDSNEQA